MTNKTAKFQFQFDGATYTYEGEPKQVANVRKSVEAARAKMEAAAAQSTKRGRGRPRVEKTPTRAQAVREWAREQGIEVGARGRMSAEVFEKFDAAHPAK